MLEKERFLAIKKLANKIRHDNEELFERFEKESVEDAISEKEEFIENIIDSMGIEFDEGEQGREEKQIFRANILFPDDMDFFESYREDKNIRNLMNKYAVSIEDVMSKITELNIYGDYIDAFEEDTDDFVDEMVNISSKEAENLLEEIEDLSNVMESLSIPVDDIKENEEPKNNKPLLTPEEITDEPVVEMAKEESTDEDFGDFDNISNAVDGFVKNYNDLQSRINNYKQNLEAANERIDFLQHENEELKKNNLEAVNALNGEKDAKNHLEAENMQLKDKLKVMENKLSQSAALLKRIYNSIPKDR